MKKQHFLISASRDWRKVPSVDGQTFILEAHEEEAARVTATALRAQGWDVDVRRWTDRQQFSVQTRRWKAGYVEMAA